MSHPCPLPQHAGRICWCALALLTVPACETTPAQKTAIVRSAADAVHAGCAVYDAPLGLPRDPVVTETCAQLKQPKCEEPSK